MNVFIRGPFRKTITLQVQGGEKISTIKTGVQNRIGMPADKLRLYYVGKMLKNDLTLVDYGIHKDATLDMAI